MKLASSAVPVEVNGGTSTSSFSIAMNGKAFRVLSDTLYQNKIGSIVREISCNAYDAHIMAGKADVPFSIHLPDAFEPWFSVQDFGVGLSPDDMVSVFTVYFQSTKDNSNDAVGAFGLGAKTPFSYTDQFTVTSVKDGVRRIYSAYITESGVPSIVEMDSSATSDINGVEIKMSVKREDYNTFANEVAEQLRFFTVKPVVTNRSNFAFKKASITDAVVSTDNFTLYGQSGWGRNWAHIIQGNVGYPLDYNQVRDKVSIDNKIFLDTISGYEIHFNFDIGEIGVTASREGVEYNQHTIANIDKKLDAVRAELNKYITDKISGKGSLWEKALFLNDSVALSRIATAAGITLNGAKSLSGSYSFSLNSVLMGKDSNGNVIRLATPKIWNYNKSTRDFNAGEAVTPRSDKMAVIVLRDTTLKPNIRAKHYLNSLGSKFYLYEIETIDGKYDDALIKKISDALGGYDKIIRLSDIVPPANVSGAKGDRVRGTYSRPAYYRYSTNCDASIRSWEKVLEPIADIDEETLYVDIDNMEFTDGAMVNIFNQYRTLSSVQDVPNLVGIRVSDAKKKDANSNLIPLKDYVDNAIEELKNSTEHKLAIRRMFFVDAIVSAFDSAFTQDRDLVEELNAKLPRHKLTRILNLYTKYQIDRVARNRIESIAGLLGLGHDKYTKYYSDVSKLDYQLQKNYPMYAMYREWSVRRHMNVKQFVKYLAVD